MIANPETGAKNMAKFCNIPPRPPADCVPKTKYIVFLSKAGLLLIKTSFLNFASNKKNKTIKKLKIPIQIIL